MGGMTRSLLLLLWAGVSVSTMVDLQKRIFNGYDCKEYERLYHVKVRARSPTETSRCGGSLISDQWILTAAHCWKPDRTIEAELGVHPRGNGNGNRITETIEEENIRKHDSADIMLLKLTTPQPRFHQIALPDCDNHPTPRNVRVQIAGHTLTTAGPGGTRIRAESPDLLCADIKAIPCPGLNPNLYDKMFCGETTNPNNPVGACYGDSGGGVVYNGKIYGVIQGGDDKVCTGPDYYVGVCGHMDWIKKTIKPPSIIDKVKDCFGCG